MFILRFFLLHCRCYFAVNGILLKNGTSRAQCSMCDKAVKGLHYEIETFKWAQAFFSLFQSETSTGCCSLRILIWSMFVNQRISSCCCCCWWWKTFEGDTVLLKWWWDWKGWVTQRMHNVLGIVSVFMHILVYGQTFLGSWVIWEWCLRKMGAKVQLCNYWIDKILTVNGILPSVVSSHFESWVGKGAGGGGA